MLKGKITLQDFFLEKFLNTLGYNLSEFNMDEVINFYLYYFFIYTNF
ncbi:DNA repair protein XRCC4 [Bienertia sinuspersici]